MPSKARGRRQRLKVSEGLVDQLRLDFGDQRLPALLAIRRSDLSLREFLARYPARSAEPIPTEWLDAPVKTLNITAVKLQPGSPTAAAGSEQNDFSRAQSRAKVYRRLLDELDALTATEKQSPEVYRRLLDELDALMATRKQSPDVGNLTSEAGPVQNDPSLTEAYSRLLDKFCALMAAEEQISDAVSPTSEAGFVQNNPSPVVATSGPRADTRSSISAADGRFPAHLTDAEAVSRAYADDIKAIGRYLSNDLSVLVICDKVLAEYIYRSAVRYSNKQPLLEGAAESGEDDSAGRGGSLLQREISGIGTRIATISRLLAGIKRDQVLVLRHLDMLVGGGGGGEGALTAEARLLTEVLYRSYEFAPTLLGFADPSLSLPKVLTDRFAVRVEVAGLHRTTIPWLVTSAELERFAHFDSETLFKNVSGFNVIQLRNAMRYLHANSRPASPTSQLMKQIREFKRGSGEQVEIPDVTFDHIGGYQEIKRLLLESIELITGKRPPYNLDGSPVSSTSDREPPESDRGREMRRKLAPRGFIFYGPPGTGKTLFAKAIANAMNATIQMVSGPEIMDMWVGKSESNLRRLFAVARRNAPAVIFFDEFDSIAAHRGSFSDGGSRAMNAVVAQLLAEMDGFRVDQDILVIGTTNRLDIIDEALLRPSRFQPVEFPLPERAARRQIAEIHARSFGVALPDRYLLDLVADYTESFNGDEIRSIFQAVAREGRQGRPVTAELIGIQIGLIRKRRDERALSHISTRRIETRR
jgi:transitional endoplasmic reticulum ATPase